MLKGERAEPYLTPSRERRLVCQLCAPRAQREGWIREAAAPEMPARPQRQPERRGLLRRRRRQPGRRRGAAPRRWPVEPAPDERHGRAPSTTRRRRARADRALAAAQPAPREGRADERPAEDRPRARAVQRVRASAHGGGHRAHARAPARGARRPRTSSAAEVAADGRLGAVLVPVRRRPLRRARARSGCAVRARSCPSCPTEAQDWNCDGGRRTAAIVLGTGRPRSLSGALPRRTAPEAVASRRAARIVASCAAAPKHGTGRSARFPGEL